MLTFFAFSHNGSAVALFIISTARALRLVLVPHVLVQQHFFLRFRFLSLSDLDGLVS
jgi:hypothetical protein